MKKNKNSFLLYLDSLEVIDELNDQQVANLFRAIIAWQRGDDFELSKLERIAFLPIKNYMKRDKEKYQEYIKQQREYGKKGGRPPKESHAEGKEKGKKGTLSPKRVAKGSEGSKGDSDSDSDSDSVSDSVSDNNISKDKKKKKKSTPEEQLNDSEFLEKLKGRDYEVIGDYKLTDEYIKQKISSLLDYCKSKGKKYKDYQATLRNWIRKDIEEHPERFKQKFDVKYGIK